MKKNTKARLRKILSQIEKALEQRSEESPQDIGTIVTNIILFEDFEGILIKESSKLEDVLDFAADLEVTKTEPYVAELFSNLMTKIEELKNSLSD